MLALLTPESSPVTPQNLEEFQNLFSQYFEIKKISANTIDGYLHSKGMGKLKSIVEELEKLWTGPFWLNRI